MTKQAIILPRNNITFSLVMFVVADMCKTVAAATNHGHDWLVLKTDLNKVKIMPISFIVSVSSF